MRKQVEMRSTELGDTATISFCKDDYDVVIEHSDRSPGKSEHKFEDFFLGHGFFLRIIGALFLDGYR